MNRTEFLVSAGVIFYLFVSLNYPLLDVSVNLVRAANSTVESHYNLKSEDLLLSYAIKTHKWNVHSFTKDATSKSIQKAKHLPEVLPSSLIYSKPSITRGVTSKISIPDKPLTDKTSTKGVTSSTIHVVKPGDTLWKIAVKYGVSGSTICKLNDLKESDILPVGMKLQVSDIKD